MAHATEFPDCARNASIQTLDRIVPQLDVSPVNEALNVARTARVPRACITNVTAIMTCALPALMVAGDHNVQESVQTAFLESVPKTPVFANKVVTTDGTVHNVPANAMLSASHVAD